MVTKVGRTNTMLICSDCGHPRAENPRRHRIRLERLATIAFLGGLHFIKKLFEAFFDMLEAVEGGPAGQSPADSNG